MTQSFINPLSKFTSDTLKTLPYSRLYFFENESSTPKEIFKDKAKTISWGVYAESDSAGNFPPIWFDGICRATLKWSSNWLTDPVGVVQTQWPIDNIGTDQSFDTDVTIAGDLTANNVYSEGVVQAAGNAGFQSTEYTLNARNPIWSFGNAGTYGISYFAGTPSIGADDKIGIHFGTATLLGSEYIFDDDGNFNAIGTVSAANLSASNNVTVGGAVTAEQFNLSGGGQIASSYSAVKTSTENKISTTSYAADSQLILTGIQSGKYTFKAMIFWSGNASATNGIRLRIDGKVNISNDHYCFTATKNALPVSTTTVSPVCATSNSSTDGGIHTLPSSAGVTDYIIIDGHFESSGSGSMGIYWAQEASTATNTSVTQDSYISAIKIG